ncbi:IS3 family transposase [Candidatus Igneacidithiobacillus taiwanensis]|uniref:IS3 family transposase n=1 Tax=Candidatus Igneacidithiobacillus taiwanensis TaxID=1945924 RepID=UPI0039170108
MLPAGAKVSRVGLDADGTTAPLQGTPNAPIESFWGNLKKEMVHQQHFETRS